MEQDAEVNLSICQSLIPNLNQSKRKSRFPFLLDSYLEYIKQDKVSFYTYKIELKEEQNLEYFYMWIDLHATDKVFYINDCVAIFHNEEDRNNFKEVAAKIRDLSKFFKDEEDFKNDANNSDNLNIAGIIDLDNHYLFETRHPNARLTDFGRDFWRTCQLLLTSGFYYFDNTLYICDKGEAIQIDSYLANIDFEKMKKVRTPTPVVPSVPYPAPGHAHRR